MNLPELQLGILRQLAQTRLSHISWQPFTALATQFHTDPAQIESACAEMQEFGLVEIIGDDAACLTHGPGMRAIVTHNNLYTLDWGKITVS